MSSQMIKVLEQGIFDINKNVYSIYGEKFCFLMFTLGIQS